jgi:hypothetical protein
MILLEARVVVWAKHSQAASAAVMSLAALFPGVLAALEPGRMDPTEAIDEQLRVVGLPLDLFRTRQHSSLEPCISAAQLEERLKNPRLQGLLCGVSSQDRSQARCVGVDVIVDCVSGELLLARTERATKIASLCGATDADKAMAVALGRAVASGGADGAAWEGSNGWVRSQLGDYIRALLSTVHRSGVLKILDQTGTMPSVDIAPDGIRHFGAAFVGRWVTCSCNGQRWAMQASCAVVDTDRAPLQHPGAEALSKIQQVSASNPLAMVRNTARSRMAFEAPAPSTATSRLGGMDSLLGAVKSAVDDANMSSLLGALTNSVDTARRRVGLSGEDEIERELRLMLEASPNPPWVWNTEEVPKVRKYLPQFMARLQVAIESSDSVFTQSRWRGHFELAKWEAITSNSASADGVLHERLDTLVPAKVTEEDFWRNYLVFVAALRLQLVRHVQNLPEEKQSSGTNVRFSIGDELADEDDDTNAGSVSRDRPATESTYASRLSSFNVTHDTPGGGKIDWPKAQMDAIGVTAERLAAAGLEFAPKPGAEDRCLCRACGIDLHSWEEGDDPFAEHSRWAFEAGKSCLRVELLQCGADEGLSWTDGLPAIEEYDQSTDVKSSLRSVSVARTLVC